MNFSHKISPSELFSVFADQPWAMWLDSAHSDHIDSRYDIIVWQPQVTLETQHQSTRIDYLQGDQLVKTETSTEDPLTLLQQVQAASFAQMTIEPHHLPFSTGAVGYCAYDLGRRFEQLPNQAKRDISLPEMAMGIYHQAIIFDNEQQGYFLICPDNQRASIEQSLITRLQQPKKAASPFSLTSPWQANVTRQAYQEKFEQIQAYLLSGDCYQINLTQRFSSHYQGDEFQAYLALREQNKAPFSAFIRLAEHAILSISPERFLLLTGNQVQSKPIKGTMPRATNSTQDNKNADILRHSAKDQAENLMIVDLLRNDISKVCLPGSVKVPKLFDIESFPAVHHLVSTVEGELAPQYSAGDLLRGAFPGGSITGAPKIRAMEIIDELEPHRRSIYCGSIGYLSACGNMDTSITIRTLVCENSVIHCWAGGGIVADSQVDAEYQESLDKVNKILPILAQLNESMSNDQK
ncbi:aminodeoxychorismate synthase component I [Thalassotalea sp. G2M2-11]|uniref:aminodeoxychorismate synthase component I n=1 Tax=Thalassotalea sp. G2M2-11 TaxID=2787627 RepID=UPI001F4969D6|nr:aminodeoxychorismate synthase component I [Thalassotalea sp. G2M2-11]